MKVCILGPLEVEDKSGQAVELGSPKQQALLALLAVNHNRVLSTDRIIDELWGDQPPVDGRRNVRVYVSRLREALEPNRVKRAPGRLIVTEPSGYALRIDPEDIDAFRFERLVGEARGKMADDPESAREAISEALSLWRDRPLAGLTFAEFAQSEIRRLEELHLAAIELRHEALIAVGDHRSVIPELEKLVAEHPLRERLVALFMEALAGSGRQAEALRSYRSLELHLADEIGLEPSVELRRLEERILLQQEHRPQKSAFPDPEGNPVGNLPARLTTFVGREREMDEVPSLLDATRLLTLTGPGGVGKTSLAVEAARSTVPHYPGGVWLVDLSSLGDSSRFIVTIADALGVKDESGVSLQTAIAFALGRDQSLLLLDNCEHMVDAVSSFVEELLQSVPRVTIICTSRRSLVVDGESVYEVAPLGLPPVGAGVDDLRRTASSRMLADRAAAASPRFEITSESAADIATLCRRLDGVPLAIELAASNLRFMTTHEIVESLGDRLSLGGRQRGIPRHRTLRATMQWSYDLLQEPEQELFDRLSVFAAWFSRDAALAIGFGRDVVPSAEELAALVDASMIVADVSGQVASYRMLPTLRDFGIFNLHERGEFDMVRRGHAEYLASDVAEMDIPVVLRGSTKRIEQNVSVEDFRAAADWALQAGELERAIELLLPLSLHWISGGRLAEAEHWLGRVNELGVEGSMKLWRLQLAAATVDWFAGRNEQAEMAFRSLSAEALEMGESSAAADALQQAGFIRWRVGDLRGARQDMATAAEAVSDRVGVSKSAREALAVLELYLGNIPAAEQQARTLAAFADQTADPVATCNALNVQGWLACYRENPEESILFFERCRDIAMEEGDWHNEVNARLALGWVLPLYGLPEQAREEAGFARDLSANAENPGKLAEALIVMGCAELDLGGLPQAAGAVVEGLEIFQDRVRRVDHMSRGLRFAGWIALADGRSDLAVRFLTAAEAEHERIHYVGPPAEIVRSERLLSEAHRLLDEKEPEPLTSGEEDGSFAEVLNEAVDYLCQLAEGPA